MSKIGSVNGSLSNYFNVNREAESSDLLSSVSILNNMWTATNNSKSGDDPEAFRSLFLAFQDVLGMVTKDGKFSIGNNAVRFGVLSDRLLENTINLFNELNSETLNGMVRKALILDIVADFSTILDMVSNVFKLSPIGILFNVTSIFVTAISNEMNSDGITSENELMPRD